MKTEELVDFFPTPSEVTTDVVRVIKRTLMPARILEPAAGAGAMLGPLRTAWPAAQVDAFDVSPQHPDVQARAFWFDDEPGGYDLVITNPPFSLAREFVDYGLAKLNAGGVLALLLPDGFMHSKERRAWWPKNRPHHVYPLSSRPSFRNGTTDIRDYSWFIWRNTGRKHVTVVTWGL